MTDGTFQHDDPTLAQYMRDAFSYWQGALDHIPEDAADGAWLQMHIDCVEHHLTDSFARWGLEASVGMPPEGRDAHDITMAYLAELSDRQLKGTAA